MKRRTFSRAFQSSLGPITLARPSLFAHSGKEDFRGNEWSASGRKLGISDQRPGELNVKLFDSLHSF